VTHSKALSCVLVVWSIVMLASGILNVAEIFLAKQSFKTGDLGFGLLWAGSGVGLILGGLAAAPRIERDLPSAYVRFIVVLGVGAACAAVAPNVWVGIAAMAVSGFGNGGAVVANITLVQRGAPDRVRGRAFTVIMSVNYAVYGLGFIVAGPLTDSVGPRWVFAAVGVVLALASLVAYAMSRGAEPSVDLLDGAEAA
jgi:MFS family permease